MNTTRLQLAGKTKLTAISIGHGSHRLQAFVYLQHDERGKAKLPVSLLDKIMKDRK